MPWRLRRASNTRARRHAPPASGESALNRGSSQPGRLFTPRGTPEAIRTKLHDAIRTILARPDVIKQYRDMAVAVAAPMTMEAFGQFVQTENEKLARDVRDNDFKPAQ